MHETVTNTGEAWETMIGVLNKQPSVIMFTYSYKLKLGPRFTQRSSMQSGSYTALVFTGSYSLQYLYNSLPLIPTLPLIMAVNTGEAVCLALPS